MLLRQHGAKRRVGRVGSSADPPRLAGSLRRRRLHLGSVSDSGHTLLYASSSCSRHAGLAAGSAGGWLATLASTSAASSSAVVSR